MRDLIVVAIVTALIMGLVGYMTGNDVQSCVDKGHSLTVCEHEFGG